MRPPQLATVLRSLLVTAAVVAAVLAGASSAFACGSNGYSYAGLQARHRALGISATVTPVNEFDVLHGHLAGWVGVSGPDAANGWLQVGLSSFPGVIGSDVYYEVALPGRHPVYHQVASSFPAGKAVEVSVLELRNRPNRWRVLLDGRPVSRPIRLPGSHVGWTPIATAESWDGGTGGACNNFLYRFWHVQVAHAAGGDWRSLSRAYAIKSPVTRIRRAPGGAAFLAAEGPPAFLLLPSLPP